MLKKEITYTDFNGETQTEDFYFNLSKAELTELVLVQEGGLEEHIQDIVDSNNGREIIDMFKKIIRLSYGRRSPDGRLFRKKDEFFEDFEFSGAFDVLFMELAMDGDKGAEFIAGIIPKTQDLDSPSAGRRFVTEETPELGTSEPELDNDDVTESDLTKEELEELLKKYEKQ